jgi:hypothetical protein
MDRRLVGLWFCALNVALTLGCSSVPEGSDDGNTGAATAALIDSEDCLAGATNGKVGICHATGSPTNPYVHIRVSTQGCIDGHAQHAGDFVSDGTCPVRATSTNCAAVLAANPNAADGIYTIEPIGGTRIQVWCLMSADGGGWTLVSHFLWQGNTAGVAGWTSGSQVGNSFTDLGVPFKMADSMINTIKATAFRAHGTATYCLQGPCAVDTTLFWKGTCNYSSGSLGASCGTAYLDAGFTRRPPSNPDDTTACSWHYGLVSDICLVTSEFGTSHVWDHEFVGIPGTFVHAYDGRANENPSIDVWVR